MQAIINQHSLKCLVTSHLILQLAYRFNYRFAFRDAFIDFRGGLWGVGDLKIVIGTESLIYDIRKNHRPPLHDGVKAAKFLVRQGNHLTKDRTHENLKTDGGLVYDLGCNKIAPFGVCGIIWGMRSFEHYRGARVWVIFHFQLFGSGRNKQFPYSNSSQNFRHVTIVIETVKTGFLVSRLGCLETS